jgi:hypothetical protein
MATPACPKTSLLRICSRCKKSDMLLARPARGARGSAIDSSCLYAKNKPAVSPAISPQNCAPPRVAVGVCR